MQVYETLDLPVDRQVVGQYLQLPRVAADFANYLQLYENNKRVYRVEEILDGAWEKVRASELAGAAFDEKLGVLGLLLARLADSAREAYRLDRLTDALHQDLVHIREGEKMLGTLLDEKQAALTRRRDAGSTDKDALFTAAREAERLAAFQQALALEKVPKGQAFERLKRCSRRMCRRARTRRTARTGNWRTSLLSSTRPSRTARSLCCSPPS